LVGRNQARRGKADPRRRLLPGALEFVLRPTDFKGQPRWPVSPVGTPVCAMPAGPSVMAIRFPASALVLEVPLLMPAPWFVKSSGSSKVIR